MSTKDTVLELFEQNRGFFISGEKIANDLCVSRTAVWKAVKKLQREGYEIEAVTNRGYCLAKNSDILSARGIARRLTGAGKDIRPEVFVTVDSTNTVCLDMAAKGESEGYVAVAGAQTKGRGRRGRSFFSPADTGIYMSILLRPSSYTGTQALRITSMAAVAVCEAIESLTDCEALIKWVNDIYVDGRKVCGILTEAHPGTEAGQFDCIVVGIGINAYAPKGGFPDDIKDRAGCVFKSQASDMRNSLAAGVLSRFMDYYRLDSQDEYIDRYRSRSLVTGRDVEISGHGSLRMAHVLGIDDEFGLIVRYQDGREEVLRSGEVSIRGIED